MRRLLLAVLAVSVALVAASPSAAHAATPCYKKVLFDWTADGVINGHYSVRCLRQAYNNVPEDLGDYSSIKDDINAAILAALNPPKNGSNNSGGGGGTGSTAGPTTPSPASPGKLSERQAKQRAEKAVPHAGTSSSIPDSSRSLPLPLLILGGIALAAALAAASLPLFRRLRGRPPRPRAAPQADRG